MSELQAEDYSRFAEFLAKRIIDRASGRAMPPDSVDGEVLTHRPADVFFIGSVGPEAALDDARANTAPPGMGLEFFTRHLGQIRVFGSFTCFILEPPDYNICVAHAKDTSDIEFDLPITLRRRACSYDECIDLKLGTQNRRLTLPADLPGNRYGAPFQSNFYRLPRAVLSSPAEYNEALFALTKVPPALKLAASVVVTVAGDPLRGFRVQVRFVNQSVNPRWQATPKLIRRIDRYEEPFLFDVNLTVNLGDCPLEPTYLELDAADFRYDNRLFVDGFNAAAEYNAAENSVRTRYAPIARQRRVQHRTGQEDFQFTRFARDPLKQLRILFAEMRQYQQEWLPSANPDPNKREAEEKDRERFGQEVLRFERGLHTLETNTQVRNAFQSTMDTFARVWATRDSKGVMGWRRFQMVFIVSLIGGLSGRASGDYTDLAIVDILWFPTGGGKTEAYLAIMIWQAFFDRLRGKSAGVTAMMRFPLRLLSLQQMQRVIEAVACAEEVRRSDPAYNGDPFTVGFLVGNNATRNKLSDSDVRQIEEQLSLPFGKRLDWVRRHRVVSECPFCHKATVDIRIDPGNRLVHYCIDTKCKKTLPLLIIDDDMYRYLPTVLVGTIDKLALIGQNVRWRQLLGFVDCYCSAHGYSSGGKCQVYGCKSSVSRVQLTDAAPAIEIQDELHLLREELGVVASHYETVAHAIAAKHGIAPIKVIASTATIQEHMRHSRALYARDSRQFPAPGPTLTSSFYADVQPYDQRLFVGIMPRRLTHINALMQLMQIEHELLQSLRNRSIRQTIVSDDVLDELLDYYEVVVTYTLRRIDQDRVDSSIDSQVNTYLEQHGLRLIHNQPMTANTTTEEVASILDSLENPPRSIETRINSITATSMISHGVDVDRLNLMNFFGMPFSTAEYIQSSSRVGRKVCGDVFVVYQAHKERERSNYQRFLKYHEFQNLFVEPVPLNRWASRGLHFTAPGLIMAAIFGLFGDRWSGTNRKSLWLAKEVLKAFDQRAFWSEEIATNLADALHAEATDKKRIEEELQAVIVDALDRARLADSKKGFGECMSPKPMQSLRDVEQSFNIDVLGPNMWLVEGE